MIEARITGVKAFCDLRDRLAWEVKLTLPRYTEKGTDTVAYFDWVGDIAFYREPLGTGALGPYPNPNRKSLSARWEVPIRSLVSRSKTIECHPVALHLSTDLDTHALERLESFRAGGRLYARVEGRINLLYSSMTDRQLKDPSVSLRETIASESYELPPHQWCEEILPSLLPPGKLLVEIDCSGELDSEPMNERFARARRAYYDGRFDDMVAELYKVFEQIPAPNSADDRDRVRGSLRNVHKGVKELLNLYRHHNPDAPALSRPVARFLLLAVIQEDVFRAPVAEKGGAA